MKFEFVWIITTSQKLKFHFFSIFLVMSGISNETELLNSTTALLDYVEKHFLSEKETSREFNGKLPKWSYKVIVS
jgi:hypothetical protein